MAKVSAKLVVGVLAGLGVLTGGGIGVSRIFMSGSVLAQPQTRQHSQLGQDISGMSGKIHHNMSGGDMSDMERGSTSVGETGQRATAQLSVKGSVSPTRASP